MTNIFKTPQKVGRKVRLFRFGLQTLQDQGWKVERIPGFGKSSVRRITKGGKSLKVSIRTSQDQWIAFPRNANNDGWGTLELMDVVLAVSVDDDRQFAQAHMIPAKEMLERFDRAYAARIKAGRTIDPGRGMWVSLYREEATDPVQLVGAGAGRVHPAIARAPLDPDDADGDGDDGHGDAIDQAELPTDDHDKLTIAEAKRRLAKTLGVDPANIKITVEA